MKWLLFFASCALFFLSGCGKKSEGKVELIGFTPSAAIYRDERVVRVTCLSCNAENEVMPDKCKNCGSTLQLPESVKCAYCDGTGDCPICKVFETKGGCRFCHSKGSYDGKTCFNCNGSGKCHICKGTQKCDFCQGSGVYKIKK